MILFSQKEKVFCCVTFWGTFSISLSQKNIKEIHSLLLSDVYDVFTHFRIHFAYFDLIAAFGYSDFNFDYECLYILDSHLH